MVSLRSFPLRRLLPAALLLLGILGLLILLATRPAQQAAEPREREWVVSVETAVLQAHAPALSLYGEVTSPRAALLTASFAADVAELVARDGSPITAGELLLRLDDREARLAFDRLEAQVESERVRARADRTALDHERELLELARRAVERAERLAQSSVASQAALDEARQLWQRQALAVASREQAVDDHPQRLLQLSSQRDQAALDLERTQVVAPYPGRVARLHVGEGDRVRSGEGLIEVYDTSALEVRARVPSVWLPQLRRALAAGGVGGTALIDGEHWPLHLQQLSGSAPAGSAGVEAILPLHGEVDVALGRFAEVVLQLPPQPGLLALPHEALYGNDRIYRLIDGRMQGLTVERIGELSGDDGSSRVLVRASELADGDRIITTRLPNAVSGLRVRAHGE